MLHIESSKRIRHHKARTSQGEFVESANGSVCQKLFCACLHIPFSFFRFLSLLFSFLLHHSPSIFLRLIVLSCACPPLSIFSFSDIVFFFHHSSSIFLSPSTLRIQPHFFSEDRFLLSTYAAT